MYWIIGILFLFLSGLIHGLREYYHKTPKVFEIAFNAAEKGFFGSLSWQRKYKNWPEDKKYKNWLIGMFPYNDFWHSGHYVKQAFGIVGVLFLMLTEFNPVVLFLIAEAALITGGGISFRVIGRLIKLKIKK